VDERILSQFFIGAAHFEVFFALESVATLAALAQSVVVVRAVLMT
jgi:hypothetical protein